jgi:hypothetical protein
VLLTKSFRISRSSTVIQKGNLLSQARTQNDKFAGRYLRWMKIGKFREREKERRQALIFLSHSHGDAFPDYKSRARRRETFAPVSIFPGNVKWRARKREKAAFWYFALLDKNRGCRADVIYIYLRATFPDAQLLK